MAVIIDFVCTISCGQTSETKRDYDFTKFLYGQRCTNPSEKLITFLYRVRIRKKKTVSDI